MSSLLDITDLRVSLPTPMGAVHVLRGVDLIVSSGERSAWWVNLVAENQ